MLYFDILFEHLLITKTLAISTENQYEIHAEIS